MQPVQDPYDTLIEAFTPQKIPHDLMACYLWLAATLLSIWLPVVNESFLRILFGVPMVLFIPGYTLIAALFPGDKDIDGIERVALSFGLSIAIVPLAGLVMNYTPWGIRLEPMLICISILTIGLCLIAQYRRARLSPEARFQVPADQVRQTVAGLFFPPNTSRLDRGISFILLIAIITAVAATVYVIVIPKEGEKFTEFFILGKDQKAADYPTTLFTGQNSSIYIGIGNHEYRTITYTVETWLVEMDFDETTNTSHILAMDRIGSFPVSLSHNETRVLPYSFVPEKTGYNRIEFLLFNDTVPGAQVTELERINQSYRDLNLWVNVHSPLQ